MIELPSLSYELRQKYKTAIEEGFFDDYERNPRAWKHTFHGAFLKKYPKRTKTLVTFTDMLCHVPTWDDVTDENLKDFIDELTDKGLAPSSVRVLASEMKALINENAEKCPTRNFRRILSVKKGAVSQGVYLTRDEMQRVAAYTCKNENESRIHRVFCIAMMTGARRVDAERLTMSNCDMTTDMLSYVPQKTPGVVVRVPVDERLRLRRFLSKNARNGKPCCQDTFNDAVRSICMKVGIDGQCTVKRCGKEVTAPKWQLVSSHTARRTFATNLYISGVSLEDIAQMMGHGKNIETTKRYICAERQVSGRVMSYFLPDSKRKLSVEYRQAYNDAIGDALNVMKENDGLPMEEVSVLVSGLRKE